MLIKPKKITINGKFWDVYIYENKLYLFTFENKEVIVVDWREFVSQFCKDDRFLLAYRCAFWNGDYLYSCAQSGIFDDNEFKEVLLNKFKNVTDIDVNVGDENLLRFDTNGKKSQYPKYFADMDVYNNKMFLGCEDGIYCSSIRSKSLKRKPYLNFYNIEETKNINVSSLKFLSGGDLLISAQDGGLFEYNTFIAKRIEDDDGNYINCTPLNSISSEHSSYVGTNYSSIMSASYIKAPIFIQRGYQENEYTKQKERYDKQTYSISEIFGDEEQKGFYFSCNERIYQILNGKIRYALFSQKENDKEKVFYNIQEVENISNVKSEDIISASVETFGIVIECKNKIIVLLSDNSFYEYGNDENNKIISYRTYPRSNCYINHLHIVYENRIEIISFNQDYFEDQKNKNFGMRFVNTTKKRLIK